MATSEVEIANLALNRLGLQSVDTLSTSASSKSERVMADFFSQVRDDVLSAGFWNFAIKRSKLSKLSSKPSFEYANEFQLPSDFLRVFLATDQNSSGSSGQVSGDPHPFEAPVFDDSIQYEIEGKKLLTDSSTVNLIYTHRVTDVTKFSPTFTKAFYLMLASEAAYSLVQDRGLSKDLREESEFYITRGLSRDSQDDRDTEFGATSFISPRF